MMNTTRRQFLKVSAAASAAAAFPLKGFAMDGSPGGKVVVIGGGFAGAAAARYVKKFAPGVEVTLLEPSKSYVTCPFSNYVLAGFNTMDKITHSYAGVSNAGVKVVHEAAVSVDTAKRQVKTASGTFDYDRLIVAPGIDFKFDALPGYSEAASETVPHAWKAGPQTVLLRKQLEAMPDGGVVAISVPPAPFRCPPGPYERTSMIAWYLKNNKPKSKIMIFDPADAFSKQGLFMEGWNSNYKGMVEWVPAKLGGKVVGVDVGNRTLKLEGDSVKAAVLNVIPPQKAGAIATAIGLTNAGGWCPINTVSFESTQVKNVHVIGDACVAAPMPKSGNAANTQAKACAAAVVDLLSEKAPSPQVVSNTCYSLITPNYGISVSNAYQAGDKITILEGSGGVSPTGRDAEFRKQEANFARAWYDGIVRDTWA